MRRLVSVIVILLSVCLLASCGQAEEKPDTLWVVTEKSAWDGMNWQTEALIDQYQAIHPELTVELEILPQDDRERAERIKRLRYLIAAGDGPDVFLLPTSTTAHGTDWRSWNLTLKLHDMEPLFKNVEQTMYNGMFADLSAYYDADKELHTEELSKQIMDAGTIHDGGARDGRYILPLRYDLPVLYVDREKLPAFDLTMDDLGGNILQLLDMAIASGDERLACSAEPFWAKTQHSFSLLGQTLDLKNGTVTVTQEEVATFLRSIQAIEAMVADSNDHRRLFDYGNFCTLYYEEFHNGDIIGVTDKKVMTGWIVGFPESKRFPSRLPMRVGTTAEAVMVKSVAKSNGRDYATLPLRGMSGELAAYVTYYGAIGAGSKLIPEAYDFLRLFLTADAQFEVGRPFRKSLNPLPTSAGYKPRWTALMEEGWPVRTKNGAENAWKILKTCVGGGRSKNEWGALGAYFPHYPNLEKVPVPDYVEDLPINVRAIMEAKLTDSDLAPLLDAPFDHIYFGSVLEQEFSRMIRTSTTPSPGNQRMQMLMPWHHSS